MHDAQGALQDAFAATASVATDVLFMAGVLAVGIALILGVAVRITAASTVAMMALMYLALWPFPAGSESFIVDYQVLYALAAILLATCTAGNRWSLGRQ